MFFWNSLALSMIQWSLIIWSLVPLPFLNAACIFGFLVHILLKTCLKDFVHYFASLWNECNCRGGWTCLISWMHCTTIFLFRVSMSSSHNDCINVVLKDSVIRKNTELEIKSYFLVDHWTLHWIISEIFFPQLLDKKKPLLFPFSGKVWYSLFSLNHRQSIPLILLYCLWD